jgi:uncharacterized protein YecT (DUF1311 family)
MAEPLQQFARPLIALLLLAVAGAPYAEGGTPSFVCTKTKSWLEKTICASDRLSDLDMEMALAYSRMLHALSGSAEQAFTAEQRKWWSSRTTCQKDKDPESCLEGRYEARIAEVKARPDYPGDERAPRQEGFTESLIKETGQGWSKNASVYMKAMRACISKIAPPPRAVLVAWSEEEGELVAMRLRGAAGEDLLCSAKKDGTATTVRLREQGETMPLEGPILWLGPGAAPKEACGKPVPVLDTDDSQVGWLADVKC